MGTNSITDVLSGKTAIKVNIGVDANSAIIVGVVLFVTVLVVGIIIKKI